MDLFFLVMMCFGGLEQSLLPSLGLLQSSAKHTPEARTWHGTINEYATILYIHQYVGKSNHLASTEESVACGDILAISAYDKKRCHAHVPLELHLPKCSAPRSDACLSFFFLLALFRKEFLASCWVNAVGLR